MNLKYQGKSDFEHSLYTMLKKSYNFDIKDLDNITQTWRHITWIEGKFTLVDVVFSYENQKWETHINYGKRSVIEVKGYDGESRVYYDTESDSLRMWCYLEKGGMKWRPIEEYIN